MSEDPLAYRIGRLLGRGAVASVHEVFDESGARYAGKFLHASRDGDLSAAKRFAQEAKLLDGLSHSNLVRVDGEFTGADESGQARAFVRMELVDGPTLDVLLAREGPLEERQALDFAAQLAQGLAYAHGHGVVHRDLKPANILVAIDAAGVHTLKIADFGMARASALSGVSKDALTILGTPDYMAPESLDPLAVDTRADLYALGCILFEMLTGDVPYPAATPFGILGRHRNDPLPALPDEISAETRALVGALMAKSPADRPPSAGAVAARIGALSRKDRALALLIERLDSSCANCGHALVEHLTVCLNCGIASVSIEAGRHCVIITGPGEIGDKMDAKLRDLLRNWVSANPKLGLQARKQLEKQIPRMPVVFAGKLSERSAQAMGASLEALGFSCETHLGWALKHPMVRKKAIKLGGRIAVIALSSTGAVFQSGAAAIGIVGLGAVGVSVGTTIDVARPVTKREGSPTKALPASLRRALNSVETVARGLEEARHRHALRAVVRQSLDLHRSLGDAHSSDDLAAAIEQASTTTASLAKIDQRLRGLELNSDDADGRQLLHRRDHLAAKMAELSGELESLRVRARSSQVPGANPDELEQLRLKIEALEEVQSL